MNPFASPEIQCLPKKENRVSDRRDITNRIDQYLRFNFYRTEGYISRLDAVIFRALIAGQVEHGHKGSLAEIGVHYGRSFFLLASGRSGSERCLAVDLFEDDALYTNREGVGRSGGFRSNFRKYRFELSEDEIVKRSSLELSSEEILSRVGRIRFFSIDGGHMYEHVANDLRLAGAVLTHEGIISLDDMFSPLWPEVAIATFDWIRMVDNRFVPFLATRDKLYLCGRDYAPFYRAMVYNDKDLRSKVLRKISVLSHEVVVLIPSVASKVADRVVRSLFSFAQV
jgi:Methyltransferase domain